MFPDIYNFETFIVLLLYISYIFIYRETGMDVLNKIDK